MVSHFKRYYVYCLTDPRDGRPFYVGKGRAHSPTSRERLHGAVAEAEGGKAGPRFDRIRQIISAGQHPDLTRLFETDDESEAFAKEREWIALWRGTLTNIEAGGPGEGDNHWTRSHPERVLRGDQHPNKATPAGRARWAEISSRATPRRGEQHGMSKLTREQVIAARARYASGERPVAIARDLGIAYRHFNRILRGQAWDLPPLPLRGSVKLTAEKQQEVWDLHRAGAAGNEIAKRMGVSPTAVSRALKRMRRDPSVD